VLKTLAKLIFGIGALAAVTSFGTSPSQAFGDAPWCAVINIGPGTVYWDCQYRTVEQCVPNVLAGNRGFCNLNPWPGPSQAAPSNHGNRHAQSAPDRGQRGEGAGAIAKGVGVNTDSAFEPYSTDTA